MKLVSFEFAEQFRSKIDLPKRAVGKTILSSVSQCPIFIRPWPWLRPLLSGMVSVRSRLHHSAGVVRLQRDGVSRRRDDEQRGRTVRYLVLKPVFYARGLYTLHVHGQFRQVIHAGKYTHTWPDLRQVIKSEQLCSLDSLARVTSFVVDDQENRGD